MIWVCDMLGNQTQYARNVNTRMTYLSDAVDYEYFFFQLLGRLSLHLTSTSITFLEK